MLKFLQVIPLYFVLFYGCTLFGGRAAYVLKRFLICIFDFDVYPGLVYSVLFGLAVALFAASFRAFFKQDKYLLGTSLMYGAVLMCYPAMGWKLVLDYGLHGGHWLAGFFQVFAIFAVLLVLHFIVRYVRQMRVPTRKPETKNEIEKELEVKND